MYSMRFRRASALAAPRLGIATICQSPAPQIVALHQRRRASNKSTDNDDLGGPGGQEPVDPTARAKQNASLRNKTIVGMVLLGVPFFYMVAKPDQIAEAQIQPKN